MDSTLARFGKHLPLAGVLALSVCEPTLAQEKPADTAVKTVQMVRAITPPVIDGLLDDDVWSRAAIVEDFHQVQPNEFAEPSEPTKVYLLYDDNALYVGARFWDPHPTARILHQREFLAGDDHFGVILDPFNRQRSGFQFLVNPNGVKVDGVFQGTQNNLDWEGIYEVKTSRDAEGWTAEMEIPFKTISFDPNTDTWGINFFRVIASNGNERIGWVSRNRSMNVAVAGRASGFTGLKQGLGLDVAPAISLQQDTRDGGNRDARPSLDAFYKITPSLNSAVTINTDFSATEVDDRQVNLTRFSLFFPEKRDFFLRDVDIFEFGGQAAFTSTSNVAGSAASRQNGRPFFSRRIGLSGSGEPVDLNFGGKLSGRIGRWDVGALTVRQDRFGPVNPAGIFVGRATVNVLSESRIGIIGTAGDPRSNVGNSLVGADFQYLNTRFRGQQTVQAELWYEKSRTPGLNGRDSAFGVGFRVPNSTGMRWGFGVKQIESNFNPALGFVDRGGIRDQTIDAGYTYRPRTGYLRSVYGGVDLQRIDLLSGGLQSQVFALRLVELQNETNDSVTFRYYGNREAVARPFRISPGVTIPAAIYPFGEYEVDATAFAQRRLSGGLTYRGGDFYGGQRAGWSGRITFRPVKYFRATGAYQFNDIDLPEGAFVTRLMSFRADVVFSSTLSWTSLVQYDNVSQIIGINSRLHWIPEDGREVIVVLNQNLEDPDRNNVFRSTSGAVTAKIDYTFRF